MPYTLIETPAALRQACAALGAQPEIGIDTEFVGEQSYASRLLLIQLAGPDGRIYLIDPLPLADQLAPLGVLLNTPGLIKVIHAGSQDVPILKAALGPIEGTWFDTQIAAAFLGYPLQTGYSRLAESVLGVGLGRDESRSDWGRRPIPPGMLEYAANDVRYLNYLYTALAGRLAERGRAAWVAEACAEMVAAQSERITPEEQSRKLARGTGLDGRGLAILRALCLWRDEEARRRDRPRRSTMKDGTMIALSRRAPKTAAAVMSLRTLPPGFGERHAGEVVARIREALAAPLADNPILDTSPVYLDADGAVRNELLSAVLRIRAIEEGIAPALIASSDALRRIAAAPNETAVAASLPGWRDAMIGDDIRAALAGRITVASDPSDGRQILRRAL